MSNSDIIEEILIKSHKLQISDKVIELGQQIRINNISLDKATAYYQAYIQLTPK